MATKKKTDKITEKFDFSHSIKAVKDTAKTVNTQVKEVAEEVVEDLKESGEELKDMALIPVKKVYRKVTKTVAEKVTMDNLTKVTKDVNAYTLKTAEEIVDGVLANGEKWQGVAAKAVKGGFKLAAKQQEIVFDALEDIKGQLSKSAERFKKLF